MFANCTLFATFCSMGTHVRRKKIWRYIVRKVMKFSLQMTDMPVYVSSKFETDIFKITLVISENVRIAFLYVLSICKFKEVSMVSGALALFNCISGGKFD